MPGPRHYEGQESANQADFFRAMGAALGGGEELLGQIDYIVARLKRRGIFDLGGLFDLFNYQFIEICCEDPGGGFAAPGADWAETVACLAKMKFKVQQCVLPEPAPLAH